jgi:hypothetical protein
VKEKPALYRGSRQKYIIQNAEFFPDTSSDTLLEREKKTGLWHLQGGCNERPLKLSGASFNIFYYYKNLNYSI